MAQQPAKSLQGGGIGRVLLSEARPGGLGMPPFGQRDGLGVAASGLQRGDLGLQRSDAAVIPRYRVHALSPPCASSLGARQRPELLHEDGKLRRHPVEQRLQRGGDVGDLPGLLAEQLLPSSASGPIPLRTVSASFSSSLMAWKLLSET